MKRRTWIHSLWASIAASLLPWRKAAEPQLPVLEVEQALEDIKVFVAKNPGATVLSNDNPQHLKIGWIAFAGNGEDEVYLERFVKLSDVQLYLKRHPNRRSFFQTREGRIAVAIALQESKMIS